MPRSKRIDVPGAIHHVIVRGIEKTRIFLADTDRNEFLSRLKAGLSKTKCQCYGWVLMPNHIHLLIRTGAKTLSDLMRSLLTGYAIYFNRRYDRHGYLYQNRYKSILCQEDAYLLKLVAYIHLNPLRAKLVKDLDELNRYPWSGHIALTGHKNFDWQATKEVLSYFSENTSKARRLYQNFIRENAEKDLYSDLMGGGLKRSAGGWKKIENLKKEKQFWRGDERILGDGDFVDNVLSAAEEKIDAQEKLRSAGWNIERLIKHVCKLFSLMKNDLTKKGRENNISTAKGLICYWGHNDLGISGAELARSLRISRPAVSKNIGVGEKVIKNKKLKLIVE